MRQLIITQTSWVALESSKLQEKWGQGYILGKDTPKRALQKLRNSRHSWQQVGVAVISSLLHSSEEPRSRTQFLLSSFGGWCLSWEMVPGDHRAGLQLNETQLPSPCAPTLLFHTSFWQLSSNFYSPGFFNMTISRTTFAGGNQD